LDIDNSVERGFTVFFAWLPALLGAIAILVIGYFVAKLVSGVVWRALRRAGLDRTLHGGAGGNFVQKITSSPSRLLGTIAFWAILLGTISLAVSVLGIDALTDFVAAIYGYLPNILAALVIFLVASAISAGVATLATRAMGDTGLGKIVATAAPILVMTIATFMILDQLMIAENIVTITYAGLIGAIALGSALAFGLGGREVAREMLQGAYQKGQENKDQWKSDLDEGMTRAKDEVSSAKESFGSGESGGAGEPGGSESRESFSARDTQRQPVVPVTSGGGIQGSPPPHDPMARGMAGESAFEPAHEPVERSDRS
jgi:hypothetical protein